MSETERNTPAITPKQAKAIECLLREPTICTAARAAGIGESTLRRWLQEPDFASAYKAARASMLENTMLALQSASGDAVTCLRAIVNDQTAPLSTRVSAARGLLEFSLKSRDVLEVEGRLQALERLAAQQPQLQGKLR